MFYSLLNHLLDSISIFYYFFSVCNFKSEMYASNFVILLEITVFILNQNLKFIKTFVCLSSVKKEIA